MVEQGFGCRRAQTRAFDLLARGFAVMLLVAVAGCATTGGGLTKDSSPEAKRAVVTERVQGFWAAMIEGNLARAYTYLSPASRELVAFETFKANARAGYQEAKVDRIECDGAVCKVRLTVTYDHRRMKGLATPLDEAWVIDEGQAWLVW